MSTHGSSGLNPSVELVRGLGLIAAVSIVIGNVIGTGVFLKARIMTCNVGTPGRVVTVWVAAGVLSLAGALTYAELAAMMPRAGGEYVFIREAYGRASSFLYGWMQIFIAKTGSQASVAVALAIFLNEATKGAGATGWLEAVFFRAPVFGSEIVFGVQQLIALAAIALFTLINCASVAVSGRIASVLTVVKIALVLGIGVGAFLFAANGSFSNFNLSGAGGLCEGVSEEARAGLAGFGAAMLGALWGYDGWNNLTLVAGEVKNPQRNIPIALIAGMFTIITLYVFVNLAYFYALPPAEIASVSKTSSVAAEVARTFLGPLAVALIAACLVASSIGTLHTSILTGARVPYAMSRDRLFPAALAQLNPRTRVPVAALVAQGFWACLLALSGSFDALTNYVIFGSWIFYGLTTASVFVFRRRMPDAERPYRAWGYPVVPVVFLLVTGWLLINTVWTEPRQSITGIVLILIGLPFYWFLARRRGEAPDEVVNGIR